MFCMKRIKKLRIGKEATLTNVMGAVQDLIEAVQTGFAKVEERFDKIDGTIERHESLLSSLVEGQDQLREGESLKHGLNRICQGSGIE